MTDAQGRVGLVRRPDKGLLGGMLALPTSDWSATPADPAPPVAAAWREAGSVEHVFTHFALTLTVRAARAVTADLIWTEPDEARRALPTVFRKALDRGLA
jgi:A/G-specific adenine glycosylase